MVLGRIVARLHLDDVHADVLQPDRVAERLVDAHRVVVEEMHLALAGEHGDVGGFQQQLAGVGHESVSAGLASSISASTAAVSRRRQNSPSRLTRLTR